MRKTRRNELELAGNRSTAFDAWLGLDDNTAKKHYSRVTEADYQRGSQMLTTTSGGNTGGNTQASAGGHESPNEKRKRLKPSENATVASDVSFGVTPTGTRTRVTAVKGRCPRPLDEGAVLAVVDNADQKTEQTSPTNRGFT